jgi:hypothetical protein
MGRLHIPLALIIGLLLTSTSWYLSWAKLGWLSEYAFFPLWVGYILIVNGTTEVIYQDSLIRRMKGDFLYLFVISIPLWWFFEAVNSVVQNWHYVFATPVSTLRYTLQASLNFSTVVPAVLSAAFLTHRVAERLVSPTLGLGKSLQLSNSTAVWSIVLSVAMFATIVLFPKEAFPLVWIAPIGLLEALAYYQKVPLLLEDISRGRYRLTASLMIGTLFTGFWWELWNYYSLPKWIYTIPYVGFWKVFEMPMLGYFGYLFFGLIVFSYAAFALHILAKRELRSLFFSN